METREAIVQLPSYLVGDLSPKEAAILEGHLDVNPEAKEAKERMSRQLTPLINLQAPEVGETCLRQLFEKAHEEIKKVEPQPVRDMWYLVARPSVGRWLARAAAVVVAVGAVAAVAFSLRPDSSIVGREYDLAGHVRQVRQGEVVQASQGRPVTLKLGDGSVQLDGLSAVRVTRTGRDSVVNVERGRVIVEAGRSEVRVRTLEHEFAVDSNSVAAFELDTAYENISGAVIELQRQPLNKVARIAEKLYSITLDASHLPKDVAERRVSMFGVALGQKDFISSFRSAAQRYGVSLNPIAGGFDLVYQPGAAGNDIDQQESVLSVAAVKGQVLYRSGSINDVHFGLHSEGDNFARIVGGEAIPANRDDMVQHMVVWASRPDLGEHFQRNDSVITVGGNVTVGSALPAGSVISSEHVQLPGKDGEPRIFKIGAPDFPLSRGRQGKVVSLTSGGVELEINGENGRVYVPLARQ